MKTALNGCLCTALQNSVFTVGKIILFSAFMVLKWRHGIPISKAGTQEQGVVSEARCAAAGAPYDGDYRSDQVVDSAGLECFWRCFFGGGHAGELPELGVEPTS